MDKIRVCGDCPWCCIHFPASGMQTDGFVCSYNNNPGDAVPVKLTDVCKYGLKA